MVVGEPQILGQIKDAFNVASAADTTGALLNKVFTWAFAVGKRVRSETALAEGAVSVSFAAVNLARKIFGNLHGRRVLVIGTGEMGKLTATHLKGQGIGALVDHRPHARQCSSELADEVGGTRRTVGQPRPPRSRDPTSSSRPPVRRRRFLSKMQDRRGDPPASRTRPLFVIDIAVPRDVEPNAAEIEQVFLYNIDDLQAIVRENLEKRGGEAGRAEQIVKSEVQKFRTWQRSRAGDPHGRGTCGSASKTIRQAELERLDAKLAGLPPEARAGVSTK